MAFPTDFDVTDGDPNKPLVLLLHGDAPTPDDQVTPKDHMVNPGKCLFNHDLGAPFEADRDLDWSWYPHVGPYSFVLDVLKDVTSWRQVLQEHGYRTAAYSQVDPHGYFAGPVQQLTEVMGYLRATYPNARIVLLAHSRGGLLVRKFLKENMANPSLVGAIVGVITLHSPHHGSSLANAATAVNGAIDYLESVQPGIAPALEWLHNIVNYPSFQQMGQGSEFLADLQAYERALPGVAYATFGGTSVVFSRLLNWCYTGEGAIAQWHWPPYHLVITQSEVPLASPVATGPLPAQVLGSIPELTNGVGDLLTTDNTARLPFAVHRTNALNHAEALWDPGLQQQVLTVLAGILPDGAVAREASSAPVYVIFGGAKFWIPNPTVLQSYGGWGAVRVVPDGALAPVPTIPRDGTVVREMSSAPVYVMKGAQKCWIPNSDVLQKYGGWGVVRVVPDGTLTSIPVGPQAG